MAGILDTIEEWRKKTQLPSSQQVAASVRPGKPEPKPFGVEDQEPNAAPTPEGTGQTLAAKVTQPSAQVPVGGEGTKPSETKPTEGLSSSQGKLKAAIDKVASGKSKTVPEDKLETLTKSLDEVESSVPANSPARSDLLQLRAEAYKLYKEKADRNEWMDVAERALNAIGQLASARAATGQQVGGLPLSRTDYGARTEQAFREYQAELGLAGEKVRGEEREAERLQSAREKEIARRRGTIEERIKTERQARAEAGDTERARIAASARENVAGLKAAQPKVPVQEIKAVDAEIKATMDAIKSANRFAAAADDKSAKASLGGFLTATGLTPEEVDAEVKSRSAGIFTGPSKKEARQQFAAERIQELRDKLDGLRSQKDTLISGQAAAVAEAAPVTPTPPAVTSAGQATPEQGIVIREVGGKRYKFDAKTKQNLGEVR